MTIANIVCNHINFNRTQSFNSRILNWETNTIEIGFNLVVPAKEDDREFIGVSTNKKVYYKGSRKKNIPGFIVSLNTIDDLYPNQLTNNKVFKVYRTYNIQDWLVGDFHIYTFLHNERAKIFAEIKANLVLKKIENLTYEWNTLTDGKIPVKTNSVIYANTRARREPSLPS